MSLTGGLFGKNVVCNKVRNCQTFLLPNPRPKDPGTEMLEYEGYGKGELLLNHLGLNHEGNLDKHCVKKTHSLN